MPDTHTYSQSTGIYTTPEKVRERVEARQFQGHSGSGEGLNNPDMEHLPAVGPIPRGTWAIDGAHTNPKHGKCVMWLKWMSALNGGAEQPNGLNGSYIHGNESMSDHDEGDSCIHLELSARQYIDSFEDEDVGHRRLIVTR